MASTGKAATEISYPSLAWIAIPVVLVPLGLYVRSWLAARKLAKTGIGKGAPGFQTGVKRIAVTPEIAARLRAGEQVSPDEIEASVNAARVKQEAASQQGKPEPEQSPAPQEEEEAEEENEWLPDELKRSKKKGGAKLRRGKHRR